MFSTIEWKKDYLLLLNQTLLPDKVEYIKCTDHHMVAESIKRLEVRGAPAIGAAAAFGMVLSIRQYKKQSNWYDLVLKAADELRQTRPTAVNLFWAINRMIAVIKGKENHDVEKISELMEREALLIAEEDIQVNKKIAKCGAQLFKNPVTVLTHCNAGALATVGYGTALGVVREAWQQGNIVKVFADETRPLLQGSRLTAWELKQDGIPVTLITDNMAGWVMKNNMVQAVIVGADRIALNGDVANKIGTYSVAVLAKEHNIPFYVAAPISTFDFSIETGEQIEIEQRDFTEVTEFRGQKIAPDGIEVFNPAFDVTPNNLISAIITEYGVLKPPYSYAIADLIKKG